MMQHGQPIIKDIFVFEIRTYDEWLCVTIVGHIPFRTVTPVACWVLPAV
jgi:hypothetical protein